MSGTAPLMLGVSGCRGIVGASLTPTVAAEFAGSFGGWLVERRGSGRSDAKPTVVLAADGRAGYHAIHAAALAGLLAAGCDVIDLGVAMTPTAGVMIDHLRADAGVVLTASHNPQQWNGLKFLLRDPDATTTSAAAPDAATAAAIIDRYKSGGARTLAPWNRLGSVRHDHTAHAVHVGLVLRAIDALGQHAGTDTNPRPTLTDRIRAANFTVVVDSVNGAGRHPARLLLERLGCRVIALGDDDTGLFWHTPEPTRDNLAPVATRAAEARAALAFCQDPDADRLALLAADGSYIGEEYTLALAARAVLELGHNSNATTLAANLSTSRMIDDIAARHAARVARTPVGEANVVSAMKAAASPIGGEGNGGVIWPAVTYVRDSLGAMALTLALMATTGQPIADLAAEIPAYAIEKRKVDLPSKDAARPAVDAVARHYKAHPTARIDTQDGVRVDLALDAAQGGGQAWVHVRASNTEPIMRLIAEAPTAAAARALLDDAARAIG
ncbi:MAG: phosphoglucosamine mutase [Phycisphaeraceae bacterium]|nr:phosphoglucosamine mutase [Phycisphaeraceae bacterium]